jgi:predicted small lipoprotein YifL
MIWCGREFELGGAPVAPENRGLLARIVVVGLVVAAVGLAGCGRKGALEAPPGMALKAANAGEPLPPDGKAKPDKKFVLDPLIQ